MFGVGVGAFWFMTTAVRSADAAAIAVTTRNALRAEWVIAVAVVQPLSGYLLMVALGYPLRLAWFLAVATAYIVTGMAWVYLLKAEYRLRDLVAALAGPLTSPAPPVLALTTFAGVLTLFALTVFRPGL
jgi:uncharacterized membrane protein